MTKDFDPEDMPIIKVDTSKCREYNPLNKLADELWEADPTCDHDIRPASGGGVRCTKCGGWFCY